MDQSNKEKTKEQALNDLEYLDKVHKILINSKIEDEKTKD